MSSFDGASRDFLAWLSKSGAEISEKIELQDLRSRDAGRGVVAAQDIEEDEVLFRVPRSAILSVENSILSKELPQATFEHLGPWLSLILVMLYEYQNGNASHWAPYFRVLPDELNTLMFWDPEELEELQASAVRDKIGKAGADENFKNELVPVIQECAEIFFSGDPDAKQRAEAFKQPQGLQLMHKMGSLIMAYAFDIEATNASKEVDEDGYASEDEDEALPKGMVPLADMLNADADQNNARLFYEEITLSMKALKRIQAGEEVFNDYGPLPRSDLLRRYGYITDNYAQYDVVEIPFDLVRETIVNNTGKPSKLDERLEYLDEQGVVDTGYDITTTAPFDLLDSISPELIVLIAALVLPDDEFTRLQAKGKLPKPDKISQEGAQILLAGVKARATQYATSLEEDMRGAVDVPMAGARTSREQRVAMARMVRIGEKKILKNTQEALGALVRDMSAPTGSSKRQADSPNGGLGKKHKSR